MTNPGTQVSGSGYINQPEKVMPELKVNQIHA